MQNEQFHLHADIEQRHWWFVARRRIMCRLVGGIVPVACKTTIVDVGCGTGANIAALANGHTCVGIDTSPRAAELAAKRFPGIRFLVGRAPGDLGEVLDRARLFVLMDVLEHVADDFAMLSELLSASAVGSYFLLTVPADESLWSEHDTSFGHYRRYDQARFEHLWAGLPVSTLLVSHFNTRLLPVIRLVRWFSQRRGRAAGRAGTDFWLPSRPMNAVLEHLFAGEARRLLGVLRGRRQGYTAGASLVAVLRREAGAISIRTKPDDLPPDRRRDG